MVFQSSTGLYNQKESIGRPLTPGYHADSRLKHNPAFLRKRPTNLAWSLRMRDRLQIFHKYRSKGGHPREYQQGGAVLAYPLSLAKAQDV